MPEAVSGHTFSPEVYAANLKPCSCPAVGRLCSELPVERGEICDPSGDQPLGTSTVEKPVEIEHMVSVQSSERVAKAGGSLTGM